MKTRLNPTQIQLHELPTEGRSFTYTNESGELNDKLKDLIGNNAFKTVIHVKPLGNAFDLKGTLETKLDLQCSICAEDFSYPINNNLFEVIIISKPLAKGDQMGRVNHAHEWQSEGPDYIVLDSDVFDIAEYVHEAIALAEPIRPLCNWQVGEPECKNEREKVERTWLSFGEDPNPPRSSPFKLLEKIKLKS